MRCKDIVDLVVKRQLNTSAVTPAHSPQDVPRFLSRLLVNSALLAADDNNVSVTSGEPELREPDQP